MDDRLKSPAMDYLFQAILSLEDEDECCRFFEDICTVAELKSIAQRLDVARRLDKGDSYTEIADSTGASTATISRVKRYLNYGADGYRVVLDRTKV